MNSPAIGDLMDLFDFGHHDAMTADGHHDGDRRQFNGNRGNHIND